MRLDRFKNAGLICLALLSGYLGWSGHPLRLPAALLFPVAWSLAPSRMVAATVSAVYFLTASRGLPQGVATYFETDLWSGLLLWGLASTGFVTVHTVLWSRNAKKHPTRYLAALIIMAIPPFGIVGWAHPLTAAGVLFPGWGWWGLALTTVGLLGLVTRFRPAVATTIAVCWLWSAATGVATPILPKGWIGLDLKLGSSLGREAGLERQSALIKSVMRAHLEGHSVIVLPESALGAWTPTISRLWVRALSGKEIRVIAGAYVVTATGYDNVLVEITAAGSRILYRERMPVPGSMWQPWQPWFGHPAGARADFFGNPTISVGDTVVAPLICYEQLLVWPILQSLMGHPDVIVAVGNSWWTAGTSIAEIQRASALAWARLFGLPLILSFNSEFQEPR